MSKIYFLNFSFERDDNGMKRQTQLQGQYSTWTVHSAHMPELSCNSSSKGQLCF